MKEFLFLFIGLITGAMYGAVVMCFFQINSLNSKNE